jgi:hypothetical protein
MKARILNHAGLQMRRSSLRSHIERKQSRSTGLVGDPYAQWVFGEIAGFAVAKHAGNERFRFAARRRHVGKFYPIQIQDRGPALNMKIKHKSAPRVTGGVSTLSHRRAQGESGRS